MSRVVDRHMLVTPQYRPAVMVSGGLVVPGRSEEVREGLP